MGKRTTVYVLVGTRKGGFIFRSDAARKEWQVSDMAFRSWRVMHMQLDPRDRRLHAAVDHVIYGATTHYSDDFGQTWTQARQNPEFTRPSISGRPPGSPDEIERAANGEKINGMEKVTKVWHIAPGRVEEPGVLYAGVEPGALFKSLDRGETWELNQALFDHPHRSQWFPGNGGLCLHTILLDPSNLKRMYVAISAGGLYRSEDGGETWLPFNKNVRADFNPDPFPEFGHCVHKAALHPARPQVLFQQNHCGVYRSDHYAEEWIDIGEDRLPSRFGFPIAIHPHQPETVYIIPEESDEYRLGVNGGFSVWRSPDSGASWQQLTRGLPERANLVVLRDALATDTLEQAGVYAGTNTGQLFYSRDAGDSWNLLADFLPGIQSVEAAVVEE
ncbi:MAG: exo-alpha-sialidase [Chloroflexi bacterium]|nr:exo-alpha-sialidase [Chloroflexota bacterium]